MNTPRDLISEKINARLDLSQLLSEIYALLKDQMDTSEAFYLHIDMHKDLLSYNDMQIISYLCHSNNIPLSCSIGGCEANRDLQELASLNVYDIQVSCIESLFSFEKFRKSYDRIYSALQTTQKPGVSLLLNTPGCLSSLSRLLKNETGRIVERIIIDRNALSNYFSSEREIQSICVDVLAEQEPKPGIGVCGGISPENVVEIYNLFAPHYIFTKMFAINTRKLRIDKLPKIILAFLVLEARVIELLIQYKSATSSIISDRRSHLINYVQAFCVNELLQTNLR